MVVAPFSLKGELQGAMSSGGPVSTIKVCKEQTLAIARANSKVPDWEIGRINLTLRNPALNALYAW